MSEVLFFGILRMPYDMAMENETSRLQFYGVAQEAASQIERLQAELDALRPKSGSAGVYHASHEERKRQIDAAIAEADKIMSEHRASRDRRKIDMPYQASGLPERREGDRRAGKK